MADLEAPTPEDGNEPVVDGEEASVAGEAPNYEALLQEEKASREAMASELAEAKAAANARMQQLEGLVSAAFTRPEAPAEPEISDEEFLTDPRAARRQMQVDAARIVQQNNQQVAQVMRGLVERSFNAEYDAVRSRDPETYAVVKDRVENYFAHNPQAKLQPGAVDEVYKYYVGEAAIQGELGGTRPAPVIPSSPRTTPPAPDGPREGPPVKKLTPAQQRLAKIYDMEDDERFEISENPEYHKGGTRV
jgi:hypothetical protein